MAASFFSHRLYTTPLNFIVRFLKINMIQFLKILLILFQIFLFSLVAFAENNKSILKDVPKFTSAFYEPLHGVIFEPFHDINWKTLAPEWVQAINVKNPTAEELKKLNDLLKRSPYNYLIEIDKEQPIKQKEIRKGSYFLISGNGIIRIFPQRLIARTVFHVDQISSNVHQITGITDVTFSGDMIASSGSGQQLEGGFVLRMDSAVPIKITILSENIKKRFSAKKNKDYTMTYSYKSDKNQNFELTEESYHRTDIKRIYSFTLNNKHDKYIFVEWQPDSTLIEGCEHNYSLFKIGERLEEIITNSYGCD